MKASRMLKLLFRLRPVLRFIKFRILHVDDSPERIARGIAVGVFIGYLPLMGIQMVLAWATAALFKANKIMAVLGAWISNPATAIIIYYPSYLLGRWLLGFTHYKPEIDPEQMEDLIETTLSFYRLLIEFHSMAFWKEVSAALMNIGLETFIGGTIIGLIAAKIAYWLCYYGVVNHRRRKLNKQNKRFKSSVM